MVKRLISLNKNGYTITELLLGATFFTLVIGGAIKIFLESQKATTRSLAGFQESSELGIITNSLFKSLTTDSRVMFASSANVPSRPEAGLAMPFPTFIPKLCRNMALSVHEPSICDEHFSMVFTKMQQAGAGAICIARTQEMNLDPFEDKYKNARFLLIDPGQSSPTEFSFDPSKQEKEKAETSDGTLFQFTSKLDFKKPLFLWDSPMAWAIMPIKESKAFKNPVFTIDKNDEIEKIPPRCRPYLNLSSEYEKIPVIAVAVEPLFVNQISGTRPTEQNGATLEYLSNYLDADFPKPSSIGQLEIKTLGFADSPTDLNAYDFGISDCDINDGSLNCAAYPAQLGMNNVKAFKAEVSFLKRLGNDALTINSYEILKPSSLVFSGSAMSIGAPGMGSVSILQLGPINWPQECSLPSCRGLPLKESQQIQRYESPMENEFDLGNTHYSGLKMLAMRGIRFILATENKTKEFYLALPQ
jgi:hypothetical protein